MSTIKKIILIVEAPFNKRDYDRYGLEILKRNGFAVEVWDLTSCLQPDMYNSINGTNLFKCEDCRSFRNAGEILKKIDGLSQEEDLIVFLIEYSIKSYPIYRRISKRRLPYCVFRANNLPFVTSQKSAGIHRLLRMLKNAGNITNLGNVLFRKIPHSCLGMRPAAFVLAGGEKSILNKYPSGPKTEMLWLHALDYDMYLIDKDDPREVDDNMGVFIDEYVPFHPDYLHMKVAPFSTAKDYYPGIRRFFDHIEKVSGAHIVIAAHPRSDYAKYPGSFGSRPVIKDKTVDLIKRSAFVVTHCSTAANFAILENKPLLFITTDSLEKSMQGEWIRSMASWAGRNVINVDRFRDIDFKKEMNVDETAYRAYKNAFIKKDGTVDLPFWQLFSERIKN